MRKGDWKLIYYHNDESFELFNMKDDIGEQHNLINSNPQKAERTGNSFIRLSGRSECTNANVHKKTGIKVALPINALNN